MDAQKKPSAAEPPDDYNEYVKFRAAEEKAAESGAEAAESAGETETPGKASEEKTEEPKGEEDAEGADDDAGEQEEEKAEKPKRKSGFQKRIDKLTREKRELEERLTALEKRVPAEKADAGEKKPPATENKQPALEDYEDIADYTKALVEWTVSQRSAEDTTRAEREREQARQAELAKGYRDREEAARAKYDDYDEVMAEAADVSIPRHMQQTILESEQGPDLAYYLAQNRKELEDILKLSPTAAARAIGKIEAKLATAEEPPKEKPKPKTTSAPKPIAPLSGTKPKPASSDEVAEDYNVWLKQRKAELANK